MQTLFNIWVGNEIIIESRLLFLTLLYVCIILWNATFAVFINASGIIYINSRVTTISALLNVPISYLLSTKLNLGADGVVLGTVICLLAVALLAPVQLFFILHPRLNNSRLSNFLLRK